MSMAGNSGTVGTGNSISDSELLRLEGLSVCSPDKTAALQHRASSATWAGLHYEVDGTHSSEAATGRTGDAGGGMVVVKVVRISLANAIKYCKGLAHLVICLFRRRQECFVW